MPRRSVARRCDGTGVRSTPCAWLAMADPIVFAFATVLTLIVVPGLYAVFYRVPSPSPA